ncbi:MAG: UDP-glucose/GDP-mannose dehydrogenase family protein [Candidatus Competibacteraceae bacterium]|nr:UDP-glucose/GDP-mannose dehydrogenase family protein [Candidatus Competibacteraceae bacterium]
MNICVIGTGYVGLVTGTCLAETGNQVICVDINEDKVRQMQAGNIPIYEPHLDVLFERNIKQGRLRFTTRLEEGVNQSQLLFLALPTPEGENGSADLSYVLSVAEQIGPMLNEYKIIIDKSTVPVGTADKVKEKIAQSTKHPFDVVSNPEFLREGFAVDDFMKPDRIVIGTDSDTAKKILDELYAPYVRQGNPVIFMDIRSAELTKYAANAFLATKISFMNEISILCEKMGADVDMVRYGIGTDERIGRRFLFPGIGYGGSCFPKDVKALIKSASDLNYDFSILNAVTQVNENQRSILIHKLINHFGDELQGKTIAIWGISFKPDTDDIREAPSIHIMQELIKRGVNIRAYDPEAMNNAKKILGNEVTYCNDPYHAAEGADALLIATEWSVFRTPDFERLIPLLKNKLVFDGRNIFSLKKMKELGFHYYSIGRTTIHP